MGSPHDAETAAILRCVAGDYGVNVYSDTSAHSGSWGKIKSIGATVVASLTTRTERGTWDTNPANLSDGEVIYGAFTDITLTSGTVHCYKDKDA